MIYFDDSCPEKILEVHNKRTRLYGFVVMDNTILGPAKGGIRMTPSVSIEETIKLAKVMTLKNALAGLPFGGGKAGIVTDSKKLSKEEKKEIIEWFAKEIKEVCPSKYVAAPDMNMAKQEMEWFAKANGSMKSCTGKPAKMGGIPHELGSTGFGVFITAEVAAEHLGWNLKDKTFAVEGFGNVGWFATKFLTEAGAKCIAVSDSKGAVFNPDGLSFDELAEAKKEKGTVTAAKGDVKTSHDILKVKADILITAAIPNLIKEPDLKYMKFKLIICGSNIPMNLEVEESLYKKGVLVIPDFVANAGGVISSYVEYIGGDEKQMWKMIEKKIIENTNKVLSYSKKKGISPRNAAITIAKKRILGNLELPAQFS